MRFNSCNSQLTSSVIFNGYIGESADIWSCGVILYAMLCGYLPWDDDPENPNGENISQLYQYILDSQLTFPDFVGSYAQDLLRRILTPKPEDRATMAEILQHP